MGRLYTAGFSGVADAAPEDILHLTTGTNNPIEIHEVKISQITLTATELLLVKFHLGTGGTAGTALTEEPLDEGDTSAIATTVERSRATQSTEANTKLEEYWNVLTTFHYLPTPEERIKIPGASQFVVELETNPSVAMTMAAYITWEERG